MFPSLCLYFVKLQHSFDPILHKPSLARDILHRRDEHDERFRGLLYSIGQLIPNSVAQLTSMSNSHVSALPLVSRLSHDQQYKPVSDSYNLGSISKGSA